MNTTNSTTIPATEPIHGKIVWKDATRIGKIIIVMVTALWFVAWLVVPILVTYMFTTNAIEIIGSGLLGLAGALYFGKKAREKFIGVVISDDDEGLP